MTSQRTGDGVVLVVESFTSPAARILIAAADAYIASLYGEADQTPLEPVQFDARKQGLFLVAYLDGDPVACGGFRKAEPPAPEGAAEVKRMFVAETARRRGLAGRVLSALEEAAGSLGYRQVVLDAGAAQVAALAFYEGAGYRRIPGFTIYKDFGGNRAYAKDLGARP